jgi:hypothetical protein
VLTSRLWAEYEGARLGDPRREKRLREIVSRLEDEPSKSFPRLMVSNAELEGFYRFINSAKFGHEEILQPHIDATLARSIEAGTVLVVHDTTNVQFSGEVRRKGLGVTSSRSQQGFMCHVSLVLGNDASRCPLGVAHIEMFTRSGNKWQGYKDKRTASRQDPTRESLRWARGVRAFEDRTGGSCRAIHVMDAEGDFFELISDLTEAGSRFVIRAGNLERRIEDEEGNDVRFRAALEELGGLLKRSAWLSRRSHARDVRENKLRRHPPREAREAALELSCTTIRIHPTKYSKLDRTACLVNVVRAWEPNPPQDCAPVEWVLLTNVELASNEDLSNIVDIYRQRWLIEEYFKAIKTGCSMELRQVESYPALRKVFALFVPVAARLLALRAVSKHAPTAPAETAFDPVELTIMSEDDSTRGLPPPVTVVDAMALIARMGGHLRNNGPPGWLVLSRGYWKLLMLRAGWDIAKRHL